MRKLTSLIAFTVALIGSIAVQAQVYPVQGNGVLIPPYSVYLADYTEGTSDRIVLNVVLNDVSRPDLRVRLRAKIIGQSVTLETKPEYIGRELVLEGGIPLRLTGIDLAEYFDPVNLNFSGISRREFEKTGALPQGLYQFCFEVLEYNRGVKISNTICANGWLILNDPPIINLPRNGEKLVPTQPQNIVFQWTPRHTGSPNSAFTTEYDVKLVELWPANRNPNDAILTSPPILEETTRSTTFIYDVSQTPLELGRHYALQIKAKSIAGADELDLFKNNGKSEVVTFIYGDPCTVPQNILLEATSATRFTARWAGDFNHTGYSLRYRLADNPSAPWYTNTTLVPDAAISGLQPNTTYEVQIAGGCGVFESLYSGTARIKTFDTSEQGYSCGMPLEQFNLDPVNLLDVLKVGDVIQAGDFDVKIAKVSGSNGTFTGEGVIEVPFFNKARVKAEFASIVVNKDMRMVNGYLNVTGAGVDIVPSGVLNMMDELIGAADSALTNLENNRQQPFDPNAFVPDTTLTLPGPVTVTDDNGTVVVTDANGVQHRLPPGTEAAIVDDQGNGTLIDSQGKAHSVSGTVATAAANREYNLALKFTEAKNNPTYGFDALDEPDAEVFKILANRYTKLEDNYYVPYKSVEAGHTTTVTGELEGNGIDKSRIRFQLGGVTMPSTPFSGNESTVTVSGKADGEEEWLIAVLPGENGTGKDQVLGRVNVVSYNKINKNVVIIPVNGNTFNESDGTTLQTELNKIYHQAVVSWSVSVRSGIQVAGIDPFDVGATGMLTNYTRHMKDVINAYKDNMKDGEDTYYIFLVKNPSDPKIAGFMPRSKQAGFIFTDKTPGLQAMARTVAHELGHGVFNLHHTFMEENFSLPENETDNLMDYAGGTKLYKYQWDMMRYPAIVMGLFESDEEGAMEAVQDHFAPPITVYFSGEPFLIYMARRGAFKIGMEIQYKGQSAISSTSELGIFDRDRTMYLFDANNFVQSEHFEVVKDHIGFLITSNLKQHKDYLGQTSKEYTENDIKYREYTFTTLSGASTSFILINPKTSFSDKVEINGIELQINSSIESVLPSQISSVELASASTEIPGNKILYVNSGCHHLVTRSNTRASFIVTQTGFTIRFSPALDIKVDYKIVPNATWTSSTYNFATQSFSHEIKENSFFFGLVEWQVEEAIVEYFKILLANTNIGARGYDPTKDDNLMVSVSQVKRNFDEDNKNNTEVPCDKYAAEVPEVSDLILSSTFYLAPNQSYLTSDGTGIVLKNNIPVSISFAFDGDLNNMISLNQIKIKKISLTGEGAIVLVYKNKPQILLENIVILPGGKVLVNNSKLVGDLSEVQNLERGAVSLIKALIALAIYKKTGVLPPANPTGRSLTGASVEVILENEMRRAILDQIKNNNKLLIDVLGSKITDEQKRNLNLSTIMGIGD